MAVENGCRRAEQAARLGLPGGGRPAEGRRWARRARGSGSPPGRCPARRAGWWAASPRSIRSRGACGGGVPVLTHRLKLGDGGVEHPVLGPGVGGRRASDDGQGRVLATISAAALAPPVVRHPDDRGVVVGVGRPRHLPVPEPSAVGLAVVGVAPDRGRSRSRRPGRARARSVRNGSGLSEVERPGQGRPATPPAVNEIAVEDVGRGRQGVDVGGEEEGRL